MHPQERELRKACHKIAVWFPSEVRLENVPMKGFLLRMFGESEMVPAIGIVDGNLYGSQDDVDVFVDLLGYESQVERVLFDPTRARFVLDAGWSGKYWRKPTPGQVQGTEDMVIDTLYDFRAPGKIGAALAILMRIVAQERKRRLTQRILKPFNGKTKA